MYFQVAMPANNHNNYAYNKSLLEVAVELRKSMTKSEACLWKYVLRARQMKGYQFRRQRPLLQYVADFMCKELMLVIELDGITHGDVKVQEKDAVRQKAIESEGFTVIRFQDNEVLHNIHGVHLSKRLRKLPVLSSPSPLQRGIARCCLGCV